MTCARSASRAAGALLMLLALLASAAHGEGARTPRTDLYGDPLPPGAVVRLGTIRQPHFRPGHTNAVTKLVTSPDGKTIVSWGIDQTLRLWDATSGKPLDELRGEENCWTPACFFAPDGKHLFGDGVSGTLRMWNVATGKERRRFTIERPDRELFSFQAIAISADGKRLAAIASEGALADTGRLLVWDLVSSKQCVQRLYRGRERFRAMNCMPWMENLDHAAFAPDGDRVTVWLGDRVGIAEIATGCLLATLPKGVSRSILFAPDGRLVAAPIWQPKQPRSGGERLALIETASGEEAIRLETGDFTHAAFTPDGRAVVVTDRQKLSVWNTATGEQFHQMKWPECVRDTYGEAKVCSLVALPGSRAATGMSDGDILVWDLAASTWPMPTPVRPLGRKELDALWSDLAGDARKAHPAIPALAAAPAQAVPLLRNRLQPAAEVNAKRIEKLLADLDDDAFETREAAARELARLHYRVEPMLRRALEGKPSLEMRRRLQAILAEPKRPFAEDLRTLRAIAVLERIGTPEARRILEKLSEGAACRETQEAQAALHRLKQR